MAALSEAAYCNGFTRRKMWAYGHLWGHLNVIIFFVGAAGAAFAAIAIELVSGHELRLHVVAPNGILYALSTKPVV